MFIIGIKYFGFLVFNLLTELFKLNNTFQQFKSIICELLH